MPWINAMIAPNSLILQGPLSRQSPVLSGGHTWDYKGNAVVRFDGTGQTTLANTEIWAEGDLPPGVYNRTGAALSALGRFYFEVAKARPAATRAELRTVSVEASTTPLSFQDLTNRMKELFVFDEQTYLEELGEASLQGLVTISGSTITKSS